MFEERALPPAVDAVRDRHAPGAIVLDAESDFEVLPPARAEELGFVVDGFDPHQYPAAWLPSEAPAVLQRYAGGTLTIGAPGDGSVVWTRQTEPPVVLVKPRVEGVPEAFVDFLIAAALVELGLEATVPGTDRPAPEQFLGFFRERYPRLAAAVPLDPNATYQVAAALYDAWLGLHTRDVFAGWLAGPGDGEADDDGAVGERDSGSGELAGLGDAWRDAGDRLAPRLEGLHSELARGETDFADATELACSAVKHALELPAPFAALDAAAYRDRGAPYAVAWAEKTFDALSEDG